MFRGRPVLATHRAGKPKPPIRRKCSTGHVGEQLKLVEWQKKVREPPDKRTKTSLLKSKGDPPKSEVGKVGESPVQEDQVSSQTKWQPTNVGGRESGSPRWLQAGKVRLREKCPMRPKMIIKKILGRRGPQQWDQCPSRANMASGWGPLQSSQAVGQVSGVCHDGLWWMSTSSVTCPESIDYCGSWLGKVRWRDWWSSPPSSSTLTLSFWSCALVCWRVSVGLVEYVYLISLSSDSSLNSLGMWSSVKGVMCASTGWARTHQTRHTVTSRTRQRRMDKCNAPLRNISSKYVV